ncbi:exopolysaccharide biosynthesis protein [Halomonas daqingensis]|uniref:Exopolysaccharide biosynthesis protein n=1 Tax=Billgrantia desiderata TaxID=52021 RepID=A0ABS9B7G9_9GAMM|nr:exopolysaccharide biosynthesis protein [Halomonas desiderata]MCE8012490.1 exopolysaccharide biosynthesis protein [Halomonas desiderata]MCE8027757.1 exopolysaccharide biosynthesis protein [Halomonas desiderata]MCE8043380.1 exopolysaccharide biosynthesis protein [Halomonas desiderata]MCE8047955.1 exopolysaccharide biosynthesis protein [Halomonas desiderata]NIC38231.1 exopolysaccharide biosynthesis protein [Halomonas desiderata]
MEESQQDAAVESDEPHNLEEMMRAIEAIETPSGRIRFDEVLDAIGRRSFGPLLLLAGMVTLMPVVSGIPGVPSLMAAFTLLVSGQLLLGRRTFWFPGWLRNRTLPSDKVHTGLKWMYKPARWIDRLLHSRFSFMTGKQGMRVTALACFVLALAMPPMELVPLTVNIAGVALTLFGLAIMARDGLLSTLAFIVTGTSLFTIIYNLT